MVNTLIDLKGLTRSIKALVYGIEWLIVDKFVDDEKTKNILRDLLCDRMSLIHEYAENKVNQEQIRIIRNLLRHGMRAEVVAKLFIFLMLLCSFLLGILILLISRLVHLSQMLF